MASAEASRLPKPRTAAPEAVRRRTEAAQLHGPHAHRAPPSIRVETDREETGEGTAIILMVQTFGVSLISSQTTPLLPPQRFYDELQTEK